MVFDNKYVGECSRECNQIYSSEQNKWCKLCLINKLSDSYETSGNEKIDNLIQEIQLNFETSRILFKWIPYNQFSNIEMIAEYEFAKLYSAIWKDGSLNYNKNEYKYIRSDIKMIAEYKFAKLCSTKLEDGPNNNYSILGNQGMKVNLKCFYNPQNIIDKFLNKV